MHQFLLGALTLATWAIGLFLLRFWRESHDRFFLVFATAFFVLGLDWGLRAAWPPAAEVRHYFYLVRLVGFVLIIVGIIDKNRLAPPDGDRDRASP